MEQCRAGLTQSAEACARGLVCVGEVDGVVAGFYRLGGNPPKGELRDLFVDPGFIGTGLGKELFQRAVRQARELGFESLEIHADPHAEGFYEHMGANTVGTIPSGAIPDRMIPLMEIEVAEPGADGRRASR